MNVSDASWSGNRVAGRTGVANIAGYSSSPTCNHVPAELPRVGSKKLRLSSELLRIRKSAKHSSPLIGNGISSIGFGRSLRRLWHAIFRKPKSNEPDAAVSPTRNFRSGSGRKRATRRSTTATALPSVARTARTFHTMLSRLHAPAKARAQALRLRCSYVIRRNKSRARLGAGRVAAKRLPVTTPTCREAAEATDLDRDPERGQGAPPGFDEQARRSAGLRRHRHGRRPEPDYRCPLGEQGQDQRQRGRNQRGATDGLEDAGADQEGSAVQTPRGRVARPRPREQLRGERLGPSSVAIMAIVNQVRIDKWPWAARFFKTRGAATEAVLGGRVHINGERVKPSKVVRTGDTVEVTIGTARRTVAVTALAERRGPASVAATMYAEMPESRAAREQHAPERRLARPLGADLGARPTKQARRRLDALRRARRRGR
jgi:ribosome-associated heat shock protein Hsp15